MQIKDVAKARPPPWPPMGAEAPAPPCAEAQSSAELFEVCAPPPPPERAHVWPPRPAEQGPRVLPRGECHARGRPKQPNELPTEPPMLPKDPLGRA